MRFRGWDFEEVEVLRLRLWEGGSEVEILTLMFRGRGFEVEVLRLGLRFSG